MGKMKKPEHRALYAKKVKEFIDDNINTSEVFNVDVITLESGKVALFTNVLCKIELEHFPNNELSYSLTLNWNEDDAVNAKINIDTLPANIKTYFDTFYYAKSNKELHFHDTWKVARHYFLYVHDDSAEYADMIKSRLNDFRRDADNVTINR